MPRTHQSGTFPSSFLPATFTPGNSSPCPQPCPSPALPDAVPYIQPSLHPAAIPASIPAQCTKVEALTARLGSMQTAKDALECQLAAARQPSESLQLSTGDSELVGNESYSELGNESYSELTEAAALAEYECALLSPEAMEACQIRLMQTPMARGSDPAKPVPPAAFLEAIQAIIREHCGAEESLNRNLGQLFGASATPGQGAGQQGGSQVEAARKEAEELRERLRAAEEKVLELRALLVKSNEELLRWRAEALRLQELDRQRIPQNQTSPQAACSSRLGMGIEPWLPELTLAALPTCDSSELSDCSTAALELASSGELSSEDSCVSSTGASAAAGLWGAEVSHYCLEIFGRGGQGRSAEGMSLVDINDCAGIRGDNRKESTASHTRSGTGDGAATEARNDDKCSSGSGIRELEAAEGSARAVAGELTQGQRDGTDKGRAMQSQVGRAGQQQQSGGHASLRSPWSWFTAATASPEAFNVSESSSKQGLTSQGSTPLERQPSGPAPGGTPPRTAKLGAWDVISPGRILERLDESHGQPAASPELISAGKSRHAVFSFTAMSAISEVPPRQCCRGAPPESDTVPEATCRTPPSAATLVPTELPPCRAEPAGGPGPECSKRAGNEGMEPPHTSDARACSVRGWGLPVESEEQPGILSPAWLRRWAAAKLLMVAGVSQAGQTQGAAGCREWGDVSTKSGESEEREGGETAHSSASSTSSVLAFEYRADLTFVCSPGTSDF